MFRLNSHPGHDSPTRSDYKENQENWIEGIESAIIFTEIPLGLGFALDLESFRLGAYKSWESKPGAGLHGSLDKVKGYRGLLTDRQAADLFTGGRDDICKAIGR